MIQEAIQLTENNIAHVAETVDLTAEEIRSDCEHMLNTGIVPVLVRARFDDGVSVVDYIVSLSMFFANCTADQMNTITYVKVTQL